MTGRFTGVSSNPCSGTDVSGAARPSGIAVTGSLEATRRFRFVRVRGVYECGPVSAAGVMGCRPGRGVGVEDMKRCPEAGDVTQPVDGDADEGDEGASPRFEESQ